MQLQDCIEELLEFTLISSTRGKIDCGLSNAYCANLLRTNPSDPLPTNGEHFRGIPSYPLSKRVARSLCQPIYSGSFCVSNEELTPVQDDLSFKRKQDLWNKLIVEESAALMKMLKEVDFELHVQEPFFSQLSGIDFVGLDLYFDGLKIVEEGVLLVATKGMGICMACICKICDSSTYEACVCVFWGLSYEGSQRLLGFVHTVGTVPELRPPPPSTLLSTFLEPYNPCVKSSTLTAGARALAKHANRGSKGYWGALNGNDSEKNRLSLDVISCLLAHCTWLNIHIVPPHGIVSKIRIAEGYGAWWSEDGTKFIGFLEPYVVDCFSKGWKH